jgi:hypothetical protein
MVVTDYEKCSGCAACENSCGYGAITMQPNELGAIIPQIDPTKCVSCGLCVKICPQNSAPDLHKPLDCFAVTRKNPECLTGSSSGGVGAGLSELVISQGGVVCGSTFSNGRICHVVAETKLDIEQFKGSKYVQSETGHVFGQILHYLKKDRFVLFAGTPCQVDGLLHFLRRPYDNLLTIDLICHGVPPQQYLKEHIRSVTGKDISALQKISFRQGINYFLELTANQRRVYQKKSSEDIYLQSFCDSLISRKNCYNCQYAQTSRCADITIGDYWGIDRSELSFKTNSPISVVLINTPKGAKLWADAQHIFLCQSRPLEDAVAKNNQLRAPSRPHKDRTLFESWYPIVGFDNAVKKTSLFRKILRQRIRRIVMMPLTIMRSLLKHLGD